MNPKNRTRQSDSRKRPRVRPVFILAILLLPGIYLLKHGAHQGWFLGWSSTGVALRWASVGAGCGATCAVLWAWLSRRGPRWRVWLGGILACAILVGGSQVAGMYARTRLFVVIDGIHWDPDAREFRVKAMCPRGVASAIRSGRLTPVASISGSWMQWPTRGGVEVVAITPDWRYICRIAASCPPEGEAGRDAYRGHSVRHVIRNSPPVPASSDTEGLEADDLVRMGGLPVSPDQVEGGEKIEAPRAGRPHDHLTALLIARYARIVLLDVEGEPTGRPSGARIDACMEVPEAMHLLDWRSAVAYPGRRGR